MNIVKENAGWQSPSNLAIIKYWGKYGDQLPQNPSLSITLSHSFTETIIEYTQMEKGYGLTSDFYFENQKLPAFKTRIDQFLSKVSGKFDHLNNLHLKIESKNSFPHSSGIASSASSMSSLALCLCSIDESLAGSKSPYYDFLKKASFIARIGSGSACRSVYPYAAIWGQTTTLPHSHQEYAIPFGDEIHPIFRTLNNDILIVSSDQKSISSTAGHELMKNNPYAQVRYEQARTKLELLMNVMKEGDFIAFGNIAENEALTLHALMMSSDPSYMLIKPESLILIQKIQAYRYDTGYPVFFSLDAGPNLHLLYPADISDAIKTWIHDELLPHCQNNYLIHDKAGKGPSKIENFSI
ncbi:MAG TPA: diphosphomevalonate decarboxylase [Saprospiraceae bacterium]|nr:diphosphomevalonate decarboxylase [Saprospiraceae bacterium]